MNKVVPKSFFRQNILSTLHKLPAISMSGVISSEWVCYVARSLASDSFTVLVKAIIWERRIFQFCICCNLCFDFFLSGVGFACFLCSFWSHSTFHMQALLADFWTDQSWNRRGCVVLYEINFIWKWFFWCIKLSSFGWDLLLECKATVKGLKRLVTLRATVISLNT